MFRVLDVYLSLNQGMHMRIFTILMIFIVASCSTSPTPYAPMKDKQGYSDQTIDSDLRMASFQGNSATKKDAAELFAKYRAIQICNDVNKPYTHILVVKDKTFDKEVSTASSTGPTYYYGMSPYYGHYGGYGGGVGMSYGTATTTVSNETYTYPLFEVYFECVDKPKDARVSLTTLSSSQMKTLMQDLKGGVQVDDILDDSPNKNKFQKGDIIIKANGDRVEKPIEVFQAARKNQQKDMLVEYFRNGVKKSDTVSFKDVTALVDEAQKEIIGRVCKMKDMKDTQDICKK